MATPVPPETLAEVVTSELLKAEVAVWARRIGVEPKAVCVRPMRRKWGSCSSTGRVTFDSGLLGQPAPFRAEVIVHELLHLRIPNHGPLFRTLLRAYVGQVQLPRSQSRPCSSLDNRA